MKIIKLFSIITILCCCFFVSLLHGQWEADVRLSLGSENAYTVFNHQHGIAASGDTVYAVWFDGRHGWPNAEIYYRRSLDGGQNWEAETRLTDDAVYSGYPSIAVAGQTLHLSYFSSENDDDNIHYMRSTDAGVTWGPDTQLTNNPVMQQIPAVAATASTVHIIYHDERHGNWEIYYLRSTDGGDTWDPEVRLTDDSGWSNNAGIVVRGQYVHVVWSDDRASSTDFDLYYKYSSDNGSTWSADTRLTFTFNSGGPSLARSGQNLFIAFQSERDGNTENFFKRSTDNGATWEPDVQLTDDPSLRQVPAIAAANSNIHIVWQDYRSSLLPEIYYKRSTDNGTTWDVDLRLTVDSLRSIWPDVAVGDSVIHVLWCDDRPGMYQIYYKRNPTGNPHGVVEYSIPHIQKPRSLVITPNPFTLLASAQGREQESFILYDICGKKISVNKGYEIGRDCAPGVYFVTSVSNRDERVRIIKIK